MTVLRLYTEYSLMKAECRLEEITERALELGYSTVAKTDLGTLAGNVEFFALAKRKGIRPIMGCEIKTFIGGEEIKLLLLAKNNEGLYELNVLSSFSMTEKGGYVPEAVLHGYSKNLIAIWVDAKNCFDCGELKAASVLEKLKAYLPFLYGGLERLPHESTEASEKLYGFFLKFNVKCVISTPVYMTRKENGEVLSLLNFIKNGTKEDFSGYPYYLRSAEETKELFAHLPIVIENTEKIGKECFSEFDTRTLHIPTFQTENAPLLLREKAFSGLNRIGKANDEKYTSRLNRELETIEKMGFSDYFLITEDIVSYARSKNVPLGHGRGSGVGSLTAFCLDITAADPIENGLIFERFLNEERVTMPDFDIDVGDVARDTVISYVREKYGKKHVCGIANYSRFALRQVIRDVGKYMGFDVSAITETIPDRVGITVSEALAESEALSKEAERNAKVKNALALCKLLEGRPRVISPHPSGIILTPSPAVSYVPLMAHEGNTLTQYSMESCEKLGLLKIDFLGIKYLTVIQKAKEFIKERHGEVYRRLPPHDERVYDMLSKGLGLGVFQLESDGMRVLLKRLAPKSLTELCDVISLYRPGPKAFIDSYIKGKKSPSEVVYPIPQIKHILEETYGCPIYQEQIMRICTDAAGFSMGKADLIRRSMAKKSPEKMGEEKEAFISGCVERGIEKEKAEALFNQISGFAKYAFNKSHGAAYALLSYESAYLKAIYPREYFAAKAEADSGQFKKLCEYSAELMVLGSRMLPPCINNSDDKFIPAEEGVRYSLSAIKGVGKTAGEKIVRERSKNGKFKDADDFVSRLGGVISSNAAVALAKSGALDVFGENRKTLSNLCEDTVSGGGAFSPSEEQLSFSFDNVESVKYPRRREAEFSETELRFLEKEFTGVDFHFNPNGASDYAKKYALYIKLTPQNEKKLPIALKKLTKNGDASVVRIYDSKSGKTSELKDLFFVPTVLGTEELEEIMGEGNVKLKALERT